MGMGLGVGQGMSSMRGPMSNIGMYGDLPTYDSSSQGGASGDDAMAGMPGRFGANNGSGRDTWLTAQGAIEAAGGSEAQVPPQYRRQVGDYFRRLAEELE